MYMINMTFTDLDSVTTELTERHIAHLTDYYQQGALLFGGRKVPRTGGIIISNQNNIAEVEQMLRNDPFIIEGVMSYEITEFNVVMACTEWQTLLSN